MLVCPSSAAIFSTLFPQLEFAERFAAAAKAGFRYVEYQFPPRGGRTNWQIARATPGCRSCCTNLPAGDFAKGERGIACLSRAPSGNSARACERGIAYAKAVSCRA